MQKQVLGFCCPTSIQKFCLQILSVKALMQVSLDRLSSTVAVILVSWSFRVCSALAISLRARHLCFPDLQAEIDLILYNGGFCNFASNIHHLELWRYKHIISRRHTYTIANQKLFGALLCKHHILTWTPASSACSSSCFIIKN